MDWDSHSSYLWRWCHWLSVWCNRALINTLTWPARGRRRQATTSPLTPLTRGPFISLSCSPPPLRVASSSPSADSPSEPMATARRADDHAERYPPPLPLIARPHRRPVECYLCGTDCVRRVQYRVSATHSLFAAQIYRQLQSTSYCLRPFFSSGYCSLF